MSKKIFMTAGPNGAGKTTTAFSLKPNLLKIYEFLNADEIAKDVYDVIYFFRSATIIFAAFSLMDREFRYR